MIKTHKSGWEITEDIFNIERNRHYEGVFTQGNGFFHVRGSLEEGFSHDPQDAEYLRNPTNVTLEQFRERKSTLGTYIPGIMGKHPLLNDEMINFPSFLMTQFFSGDERFDIEDSIVSAHTRTLDLKTGILSRSFIWEDGNSNRLRIETERFTHSVYTHLFVHRIRVTCLSGNTTLGVSSGIDGRVRTNGYNHFSDIVISENRTEMEKLGMRILTDSDHSVAIDVQFPVFPFNLIWTKRTDTTVTLAGKCSIRTGETKEFLKLTLITVDEQSDGTSISDCLNYEKLYSSHIKEWSKKWESCDVRISGDPEAQLALRFSLYHLLRCLPSGETLSGIDAKGAAGEAYYGRYFWDTEICMAPFYFYTSPDKAKPLIELRAVTLEGAKKNASGYGYTGARYPWESSLSGTEQCPCWQYADHEVHVTADVAFALWHYFLATGDVAFMLKKGVDVLVETARYWTKRVDYDSGKGIYHLLGVMGPDEYHLMTRDNAFTNYMVKFTLGVTLECLKTLRKQAPEEWGEVTQRLALSEKELETFFRISESLPIHRDDERKLILQCEYFFNYVDIDFESIWSDRTQPFGRFVSQERMYRTKCLKQADVLALMYLFPGQFTCKELEEAYNYYEKITTHDSSLSPYVHAIIAAWIGKMEESWKFFMKSAFLDLDSSKGNAAEGIHIANSGGLWQIVVMGYAGLVPVYLTDILTLHPRLPAKWEEIEFPLVWKGKKIRIAITQNTVRIENYSEEAFGVKIHNERYSVPQEDFLIVWYESVVQ